MPRIQSDSLRPQSVTKERTRRQNPLLNHTFSSIAPRPLNPISNHFDEQGNAHMVDVSQKKTTVRVATASASVMMDPESAEKIRSSQVKKGDVLGIARIAAIQAVKSTPQLIPLCHAIPIEAVSVDFFWENQADAELSELRCEVEVRTSAKTGVEMEAMTAVTVACLTIYDMIKSFDRSSEIRRARLLRKSGGKSGDFEADSGSSG